MNLAIYLFIAVIIFNIPLYLFVGKIIFGNWGKFLYARRLDLLRHQVRRAEVERNRKSYDHATKQMLLFWIACVPTTLAEYFVIAKFLFNIEKPWKFLEW